MTLCGVSYMRKAPKLAVLQLFTTVSLCFYCYQLTLKEYNLLYKCSLLYMKVSCVLHYRAELDFRLVEVMKQTALLPYGAKESLERYVKAAAFCSWRVVRLLF